MLSQIRRKRDNIIDITKLLLDGSQNCARYYYGYGEVQEDDNFIEKDSVLANLLAFSNDGNLRKLGYDLEQTARGNNGRDSRRGDEQSSHVHRGQTEKYQNNIQNGEHPIFRPGGLSGAVCQIQAVTKKSTRQGNLEQVDEMAFNEFGTMREGYVSFLKVLSKAVNEKPIDAQSDHKKGQYNWKKHAFELDGNQNYTAYGRVQQCSKFNNKDDKGPFDALDNLCKEGKVSEAVIVLDLLEKQRVTIDIPRYIHLFQLCGDTKSLEDAKLIHAHIKRVMGDDVEIKVYNKMLDLYFKCGSVDDACDLFDAMPQRNLTSWDVMIMGLANNGCGEEALDVFSQFKQKGLKPDSRLFLPVFHACGILGAVDEGLLHFDSMSKEYGIVPTMEHYVGIVSMFGSAGYLEEALEFIEKKMPCDPSVSVWETLMNLCRVHGNVDIGDRCVEIVESMDPSKLTLESSVGLVPARPSDLVKKKREEKKSDMLGVRTRVHEYRSGDRSHPESDRIYTQIYSLDLQMKDAGYVPDARFVIHDIDLESKEEALLHHSERLATAFALMSSPARTPVRIIKNLRICVDCHNALKIVSKLVGREFIIRDTKRFHHMENGVCSCGDYW